jgi:anti-sigma factor RsiW
VSCPRRYDVAPYALGTLGPAERPEVAAHLASCPDCQGVLASIGGLPALLARVRPDDVEAGLEPPDEAMFERLVARSAGVRAPHRQRRRRAWAASIAAAAVLAAGGAWFAGTRPHDGTQVVAASRGSVHATVWVRQTPTGTAVRLELAGVPAEEHCRLVAVDRAGHRSVAATWEASYTGTATFDGSVPVPSDELAALQVETDTATLLRLPLS